jgi:hypothetical protein
MYVSYHFVTKTLVLHLWLLDCKAEGPMFIQNSRHHWPSNTASHSKRCTSSATLLWEPQILHLYFLFLRLATGWTVRGSNLGGGEIFCTHPDRLWGPPILLCKGYWIFPSNKAARTWCWPPTPFNAEVKEIVLLYLYFHSRPLWPVLGW